MAARTFRIAPGRQFRADGPCLITCLPGGELRVEPVPWKIAVVKADSGGHNVAEPSLAMTPKGRAEHQGG